MTGIIFCIFPKLFYPTLFNLLKYWAQSQLCWSSKDLNTNKTKLLSKSCGEHMVSVIFLPSKPFDQHSATEQKAHIWVTQHLHDWPWSSWKYSNGYLSKTLQSFSLRYPLSLFYAKREGKSVLLEEFVGKIVENWDNFGCTKVNKFVGYLCLL